MKLFDLFSKKEDPLHELKQIKADMADYVTRLEQVSQSMTEQLESIQQLPIDNLPEKLENNLNVLYKNEAKLRETEQSIAELKSVKNGSEEFENQLDIVTKNLGAFNAVIEMELMDANSHFKLANKFFNHLTTLISDMQTFVKNIPNLDQKLATLDKRITELEKDLKQNT